MTVRALHSLPIVLLATLIALTGAFPAFAQSTLTPDAASDPITILLLGSDARPGEEIDAVRSDIMAVVHLDPVAGTCRMLSIGRDTRVSIPGVGATKINHALMVGGVPQARHSVEELLGIQIDAYGLIDFAGAAQVIDAIGGITLVNDEAFAIGGNQFPLGEITLNGSEAVLYARYRGGVDGDIGRMRRQQAVLIALLGKVDATTARHLLATSFSGIQDHVSTSLSPEALLALASVYAGTCTRETFAVDTIPYNGGGMMWDDLFGQVLWFGTYDPTVVEQKVDWLLGNP